MRRQSVPIGIEGSAASGATASAIISVASSGSSPCTLTISEHVSEAATSARRSLPLR